MNLISLDSFIAPVAGLCAVMAVVSLLRTRSRGPAAVLMAVAFLVLGFDLVLIQLRAPLLAIGALGAVVVVLLIAEFAVRSARLAERDRR